MDLPPDRAALPSKLSHTITPRGIVRCTSSAGHGGLMATAISQFGQDWKEVSFPSRWDDVRHDATPFMNHAIMTRSDATSTQLFCLIRLPANAQS